MTDWTRENYYNDPFTQLDQCVPEDDVPYWVTPAQTDYLTEPAHLVSHRGQLYLFRDKPLRQEFKRLTPLNENGVAGVREHRCPTEEDVRPGSEVTPQEVTDAQHVLQTHFAKYGKVIWVSHSSACTRELQQLAMEIPREQFVTMPSVYADAYDHDIDAWLDGLARLPLREQVIAVRVLFARHDGLKAGLSPASHAKLREVTRSFDIQALQGHAERISCGSGDLPPDWEAQAFTHIQDQS